jgi:threonine dehydratase
MRAYYTDTHNIAEGAGAVPLAGLMKTRDRWQGRKVGVVLSGGNVDMDVYRDVLTETA